MAPGAPLEERSVRLNGEIIATAAIGRSDLMTRQEEFDDQGSSDHAEFRVIKILATTSGPGTIPERLLNPTLAS